MGKVENENYYQVSGWMINELKLKGNELLIYAIIYGFTQTCNCFSGGLSYLEEFIGATKPTVLLALRKLTEKGFLIKEKVVTDKGICCVYKTVKNFNLVKNLYQGSKESLPGVVKILDQGSKESLPNNNIYNNSDNNKYTNKESEQTHKNSSTETRNDKSSKKLNTFKNEDYSKVYETYFSNCEALYKQGRIQNKKPVLPDYGFLKKKIKKAFETYGVDAVISAVKESINHKWLIEEKGYAFTCIFGPVELPNLINKTYNNFDKQQNPGNSSYKQVYTDEEYRAWSDDPADIPF